MKSFSIIAGLLFFVIPILRAQTTEIDSLPSVKLEEVVVMSKVLINYNKQSKPLSSLDEYLEKSSRVSMVKRGNYAWEPMINNMSSERLSVTIDGMHIFGACTDKMDPITSYVDVSNLSEVNVFSGQEGSSYGPTIGGGIDLVRTKHDFCYPGWSGSVDLGYESNGNLFTTGTNIKYVHPRFFADVDFMYRDAGNYVAGKRMTVPFSQFTKYNTSVTLGAKLHDKHSLIGSFIFDNAKDIGYPALPMDVSLARAYIATIEHTAENLNAFIEEWNTKIYFNTISHRMDDTKRPAVPIHMDMPGWSTTYGFYSRLKASKKKQEFGITLNAYYNQSKAEMTMYPEDSTESAMFMYTWPDVRTIYSGVNVKNKVNWKQRHILLYSAGLGFHRNQVASDFGLNSLRIFYPGMKTAKNRCIMSAQVGYTFQKNGWELSAGIGYGERAPSVSEGYGFYLFNSFDRYDYIGNPYLKNEKSIEVNGGVTYKITKLKVNASASYFRIVDYIIGIPNMTFIPMTIGASGVREYKALKAVNIFNTELGLDYRPHPSWRTKAAFTYSLGRDYDGQNLPLIRPFSFRVSLAYKIKSLDLELGVEGASKQYAYSKAYGEDKTPAYAVVNFSAGYLFLIQQHRLYMKFGVENIGDTNYSTYSDWNNIPRKGRNFFINLSFAFENKKKQEE
ncbi:MAG: TonB-dependent receptor [Chitinophagales bacterium]